MTEIKESFIRFPELINLVEEKLKFLLFLLLLSILSSLIVALVLPNTYKSEALISIDAPDQNPMSSMLDRYSGVASLAGISLPSGAGQDKSLLVIETIKSRDFLRHLLKDKEIKINLMAYASFNPSTNELLIDKEIYDESNEIWLENDFYDQGEPTFLEVYEIYRENLSASQDKVTGFVQLSFTHISPVFAQNFLERIIDEANNLLRIKAIDEADHSLNFLRQLLPQIAEKEIQISINSLIKQQLQSKMLASANQDYLLKSIDRPFFPEKKSDPQRSLILVMGFMIGILINFIYLMIVATLRKLK
tara:strand:- start:631 stop:1545 length:915 start_codon:yes stop_codon:yes gene_type:complete